MKEPIIALGVVVIICIALDFVIKKNKKEEYPYKARTLLTPGEFAFYNVLTSQVPQTFLIFAKVRLWDIIDVTVKKNAAQYTNKIRSKHVDFILTDKTGAPKIVIELDDKSHNFKSRKERDEFVNKALAAASINIIHIKAAATYNASEIRNLLNDYI